jgi:cytochrome c oxidase subunit 1
MVSGIVLIVANLIRGLYNGPRAPMNPWGGTTLEWKVPSPPPLLNFETPPVVTGGPYEHNIPNAIIKEEYNKSHE